MSLISQKISHLFNGVSQQAPSLRSASQAQRQVNALSSPVEGLTKRPSLTYTGKLADTFGENPAIHTVNRDDKEQYQVVIDGGELKVFDLLTGNQKTVSMTANGDYLQSDNPREDLRLMTMEDYTFIVNRNVVPTMEPMAYTSGDIVKAEVEFVAQGTEWAIGLVVYKTVSIAYGPTYTSSLDFGGKLAMVKYFRNHTDAFKWFKQTYVPSLLGSLWWNFYTHPTYEDEVSHLVYPAGEAYWTPNYADRQFETNSTEEPEIYNPTSGTIESYTANIKNTLDAYGVIDAYGDRLKLALNIYRYSAKIGGTWTRKYSRGQFVNVAGSGIWEITGDFFLVRPNDDSTKTGPGEANDPSNLLYAGSPYQEGFLELSALGESRGLYVNGQYFEDPVAIPDEDKPAYFAGVIDAAFPTLSTTALTGKIIITADAGAQLTVRPSKASFATVRYDFSANIKDRLFIVIKSGVADQTYQVSINGNLASYSTGTTAVPDTWRPMRIAQELATDINGWAGFTAEVFGNLVMVTPPAGTLTFDHNDTWNNQAMTAMKNRVPSEDYLPQTFVEGIPIQVGTEKSGFWVHYVAKAVGDNLPSGSTVGQQVGTSEPLVSPVFGDQTKITHGSGWTALEGAESGLWEETAYPWQPRVINPATMPHALVAKADGTFEFKQVSWFYRKVGDARTAPPPSFVGKPIQDVFFYRNRLGFLTEESAVFSKAGTYFDFFPDTLKEVLDSDAIDVQVSHTRVSILRSAVVFNNTVLLFADSTQFAVTGGEVFTPRTVNIRPMNEYDNVRTVKPVNAGDNVFFANERSGYSQVMEYVSLGNQGNSAVDTTGHVPTYLPSGLFKMTASSSETCLAIPNDNQLFVYKYLWGNQQEGKLQESWSQWSFDGEILSADFVKSRLYLVVRRTDGVFLGYLDMRANQSDSFGYLAALDWKYKTSGSTITLPYEVASGVPTVLNAQGEPLVVTRVSATEFTVAGASGQLTVGIPFETTYEFSPVFMRDSKGLANLDGKLMLKTFSVEYTNSMKLTATVKPRGRSAHSSSVSKAVPTDGVHRFAVMTDGVSVSITISDATHYPMALQGASWEGSFMGRNQKL